MSRRRAGVKRYAQRALKAHQFSSAHGGSLDHTKRPKRSHTSDPNSIPRVTNDEPTAEATCNLKRRRSSAQVADPESSRLSSSSISSSSQQSGAKRRATQAAWWTPQLDRETKQLWLPCSETLQPTSFPGQQTFDDMPFHSTYHRHQGDPIFVPSFVHAPTPISAEEKKRLEKEQANLENKPPPKPPVNSCLRLEFYPNKRRRALDGLFRQAREVYNAFAGFLRYAECLENGDRQPLYHSLLAGEKCSQLTLQSRFTRVWKEWKQLTDSQATISLLFEWKQKDRETGGIIDRQQTWQCSMSAMLGDDRKKADATLERFRKTSSYAISSAQNDLVASIRSKRALYQKGKNKNKNKKNNWPILADRSRRAPSASLLVPSNKFWLVVGETQRNKTTLFLNVFSRTLRLKYQGFKLHAKQRELQALYEPNEGKTKFRAPHDCRLIRKRTGRYYLAMPRHVEPELHAEDEDKRGYCALDPGVRTFQTGYDPSGAVFELGHGETSAQAIACLETLTKEASQVQRTLAKFRESPHYNPKPGQTSMTLHNWRTRQRGRLKRKVLRLFERLRHRRQNFHHNVATWLVTRYRRIFLPKFATSNMVRTKKKKEKVGNPTPTWWKGRGLNKTTVRCMLNWAHYQFRQRLLAKAKQHGNTEVIVCGEHQTSKTCALCSYQSNLDNGGKSKQFLCSVPGCGYSNDRDVNAAFNIFRKCDVERRQPACQPKEIKG